jgi:His-Xaa-Ser repeat protein HxsA
MEEWMRKLILATASVFALGMAASGVGYAQQTANPAQAPQQNETNQPAANTNQPSANMPAANEQAPNATMQQGEQSTASVRVSRQQVRQIQEQLKTQGLYKGRIDGMMGPETKQAIQQFQQQNNLQATGTLDQQTLAALSSGTNGQGSNNMNSGTQPSNTGDNNETGNQSQQPNTGGYRGQTQYK